MFLNFSILLLLLTQLYVHAFIFIFLHMYIRVHVYTYIINYYMYMTPTEWGFWTLILNTDAILFFSLWFGLWIFILYYFWTRYQDENFGMILLFTFAAFNGIMLIGIHGWWIFHFSIAGCPTCQEYLLHTFTLYTDWISYHNSHMIFVRWSIFPLILRVGCWLIFKK